MRPCWRGRAFAAALVLPLALMAAFALAARIVQHGWTDNRIFAVAWLLLMGGYALTYGASALISLGGGGWMRRIEGSNLALGFAGVDVAGGARLAYRRSGAAGGGGAKLPLGAASSDGGWL